jgi:hypothetical protein
MEQFADQTVIGKSHRFKQAFCSLPNQGETTMKIQQVVLRKLLKMENSLERELIMQRLQKFG